METELKPNKCPFEVENDRKYYLLAGGRIELQDKAGGSSARIYAKTNDETGEHKRYSTTMLTVDRFMESMADAMHIAITNHEDKLTQQNKRMREGLAEIENMTKFTHGATNMVEMVNTKAQQTLDSLEE